MFLLDTSLPVFVCPNKQRTDRLAEVPRFFLISEVVKVNARVKKNAVLNEYGSKTLVVIGEETI